jgi:hypothetical protein
MAGVAGSLAIARGARAAQIRIAYAFDPFVLDPITGLAVCGSCSACLRHAEHKLFASAAIADQRRAHPHCRCAIRPVAMRLEQFDRLFSNEVERRQEVDLRWEHARIVLEESGSGGLEMPVDRVR